MPLIKSVVSRFIIELLLSVVFAPACAYQEVVIRDRVQQQELRRQERIENSKMIDKTPRIENTTMMERLLSYLLFQTVLIPSLSRVVSNYYFLFYLLVCIFLLP